jgi:short-subunit dehydrogenase
MNKKNVIIFGGTGDLGLKVLDFFFKSKYNIVYSSTSKKLIKKTQVKYSNYEKSLTGIICDFKEENDIKNIINFSYDKFKSINVVVNCAGVFQYDNLNNLSYEKIINIFKINSFSLISINKFLNKRIKKNDYAKVISIGSSSSYIGSKNTIVYCSSKHALQGIIKSLNQTIYKKNILNYSINPGTLNNKMGKKVKNINNENLIEQEEIIKTISYLISLNFIAVPEDIYLKRFTN